MVSRIKKNDRTVPYLMNGYYYYSRYEKGKEYAIYCRKKGSLNSNEEIILDANELSKSHDYPQSITVISETYCPVAVVPAPPAVTVRAPAVVTVPARLPAVPAV